MLFFSNGAFAGGLLGDAIEGICGNCGAGRALDRAHESVGQPLDVPGRVIREASVETIGPLLAEAIRHSRNNARRAGTRPIPRRIRSELGGFYPASILNSVQFRVGQGHELSVQANSIKFGDAVAVALIDTIVFASGWDAENNVVLWAHELRHIVQYQRWGLTDFGKRYVRSHRSVESEAERAENEFVAWRNRQPRANLNSGPRTQQPISSAGSIRRQQSNLNSRPRTRQSVPSIASICRTNFGICQMGTAIPVGSQCYCPSWQGAIWGVAQ